MLSREAFLVTLVAVCWVGGFLPLWLAMAAPGSPRRGASSPPGAPGARWTWWQCVGLALVLSPFVRGALNFVNSIELLIATDDVLQAIPRAHLYDLAWTHFRNNLLIPGIGLLMIFDAPPGALPEVWRHVGAGTKFGGRRDTLHGFALFLALALVYAGALALLASAPSLQADGDESQVWRNVTPDIVLLLALVSGIGEEFVYRGLMLGALARVMPWWAAAFTQAVFFGLVHAGYGTWIHVIAPFLFGLGMAVVVRGLGIVPAMILHGGINATIFAFEASRANPTAMLIPVALFVASVYALWRVRLDPIKHAWRAMRAGQPSPDEERAADAGGSRLPPPPLP